jgi:BA14K-like protein
MSRYRRFAAVAVVSGALTLTGSSIGALPLSAGAKTIAAEGGGETSTMQVQARRVVRAPRIGIAPRIGVRPIIRPRAFVRRPSVIIGIGPGLYYGTYPYYYEPYYDYEAPYDDAIAYCIQRFKSYDVRTRTYLGYDGLRHPCP